MDTGLFSRALARCERAASAIVPVLLLSACVSSGAPNASGVAPVRVDPGVPGPVSGIGIEGQDIVAMTDQMMRDMLANQTLAGRAKAPRILIDSRNFKNGGSQAINRDLITERLRVNLNRAAQGRMTFLTRSSLDAVQEERDLKRQGVTDSGTTGLTKAMAGSDFLLRGTISTLDARSGRSGLLQRYNQVSFEMVDVETAEIVWSGLYEFERAAADDVVYR